MKKSFVIVGVVLAFCIILTVSFVIVSFQKESKQVELGLRAVKYMYNFQTLAELDDNMDLLKGITTDEVYSQLTVDNTDRALNVYLKFKNKPVLVIPEEATSKYVIYKLQTESLSSDRKFAFFFEVDNGKISKVRESEIIDFVDRD